MEFGIIKSAKSVTEMGLALGISRHRLYRWRIAGNNRFPQYAKTPSSPTGFFACPFQRFTTYSIQLFDISDKTNRIPMSLPQSLAYQRGAVIGKAAHMDERITLGAAPPKTTHSHIVKYSVSVAR